MKIFNKILLVGTVMLSGILFSCEKRHIDDNIPPSVINFSRGGFIFSEFYDVEGTHVDTFYVTNAGFEVKSSASVSIAVDEGLLADYNSENGTEYMVLPSQFYELSQVSGVISADQRTHSFMLTFDCAELAELGDLSSYVVPLRINTPDGHALGEQSVLIVQPKMLAARLMLRDAGIQEIKFENTSESTEFTFTVAADFKNQWDIGFEIIEGQAVLDEYNQLNSTNFRALPREAYTVEHRSTLTPGISSADIKFSLNNSAVPDGVYAVAVKLVNGNMEGAPIDVFEDNVRIIRINNGKAQRRLDRGGWSVSFFDSFGASDRPEKILDGDHATFWQPAWNASHFGSTSLPYSLVVDMGKETSLEGFEVWRRPGNYVTDLKKGSFEVSLNGVDWIKATDFDFGDTSNKTEGPIYVYIENVVARYVRILITESNRNQSSNLAEFYGVAN
jgi:hypothetical protein